MYANGISLNASSYKNLFSSASGTLYVPVKPSAVIYSQLDYVHGVSAGADGKGVSVNRIRILNTLIHQLVAMKKSTVSSDDLDYLTDEQKDALIETYQQEIRNAVNAAQTTPEVSAPGTYGLAGLMPEVGTIVDVSA